MNKDKRVLTEQPALKSLLTLAFPIMLVNLLQTAYQMISAFWVGRLGADAVAAVAVNFPVNFLLLSVGSGLAVAGSVLTAQYTGAKNMKMVNHIATQTIIMVLVIALFLAVTAYALSPNILRAMGISDQIFQDANTFQRLSFIGLVFTYAFLMFQSVMRGVGQVKLPLYINIGTVMLSFVLNPLLIFGWGMIPAMGIAGAGIAILSTQLLSVIIGYYYLFRGNKGIKMTLKGYQPDWPLIKQSFRLGFPASIELGSRSLGMSVMTVLATGFSISTLAVYGIGIRLISFIIIPAMGISMACSTLVAQNLGARNPQKAEKISRIAVWSSFVLLSVVAVIFHIFAETVVRFFVKDNPEIISEAVVFVRIAAWSFGFIGMQQSLIGAFRGAGNTMITMVLGLFAVWGLQFPIAYFVSRHTGLGYTGLWWSFPISNVIAALIAYVFFVKGDWRKEQII